MSKFLNHKIDFAVVIMVRNANPNGDPLLNNRPRMNAQGYGVITDVCVKRKIRNRLADLGLDIYVQSADRRTDDFDSLQSRAEDALSGLEGDPEAFQKTACKKWVDVRAFGQLFAYSTKKKKGRKSEKESEDANNAGGVGVSVGIRGPVTVQPAISISPIEIEETKIVKSVNGISTEKGNRSSDTMGDKFSVPFGVYVCYGSINSRLAEKTGFTAEDAEAIHEALKSLFENDESSARPSGSMEVIKVYWFEHPTRDGSYPSGVVHRSIQITPNSDYISSIQDVTFERKELPNLPCDEYSTI